MEKQQKYRNHGKRKRKGYEKSHAVLPVQLVYNHHEIDVTERNEADGKNPEHMIALGYHFRTVCSESPGNHSREKTDQQTSNRHRNRNEEYGFPQNQTESMIIVLSYLDSPQ